MTIQSPSRRLRLFILSLSLFCSCVAAAQSTSPAGPPGVSVLDCKWEKTRYIPSLPAYPQRPSADEVKQGMPNSVPPMIGSSPGAYLYSIRVRNEGPKVIKSMAWDYVFNAPDSNRELGRRSFNSYEKIKLNETKWINLRPQALGPPNVTTIGGLKKDRRSPFDERIEIKCILYADDTGWRAADADPRVCEELVKLTLHPDQRPR